MIANCVPRLNFIFNIVMTLFEICYHYYYFKVNNEQIVFYRIIMKD